MRSKLRDRDDWFDIWFEDKKSILDTMTRNMASDLAAGYDPSGKCIREQTEGIFAYKREFEAEMDGFKSITEEQVNRWCFYDMKKRGVIM